MRRLTGRMVPLLFLALLLLPACGRAHTFDVQKDTYVDYDKMIDDLKQVRLIFIGELHDNLGHHQAQLQIIRSLHDAGISVTIGLEMIRHDSQPALDRWVMKTMNEQEFIRVFDENWSMWPVYRDIFLYARKAAVPMLGLNISRNITRQVARDGFDSLTPQQRKEVPLVSCDVDQTYQNYIHKVYGGFFHRDSQFLNFCEAQMVWDAVMAKNLIQYLDRTPGRTVVVLAGTGHAWKFGIPEQIRRHLNIPYRVVLPEIPGRIDLSTITPREADYLLVGADQGPLH